MKLYHGSYTAIENPDIKHSRFNVDFGPGFYVTTLYEQAVKWVQKFKHQEKDAVVSVYCLDENALVDYRVLEFKEYSDAWLDFILDCCSGRCSHDYDIIIGGVANDKVFNTVELFFDGLIDKSEALKRLKYEKPNLQICFSSQEVMDRYLKFERSEKI